LIHQGTGPHGIQVTAYAGLALTALIIRADIAAGGRCAVCRTAFDAESGALIAVTAGISTHVAGLPAVIRGKAFNIINAGAGFGAIGTSFTGRIALLYAASIVAPIAVGTATAAIVHRPHTMAGLLVADGLMGWTAKIQAAFKAQTEVADHAAGAICISIAGRTGNTIAIQTNKAFGAGIGGRIATSGAHTQADIKGKHRTAFLLIGAAVLTPGIAGGPAIGMITYQIKLAGSIIAAGLIHGSAIGNRRRTESLAHGQRINIKGQPAHITVIALGIIRVTTFKTALFLCVRSQITHFVTATGCAGPQIHLFFRFSSLHCIPVGIIVAINGGWLAGIQRKIAVVVYRTVGTCLTAFQTGFVNTYFRGSVAQIARGIFNAHTAFRVAVVSRRTAAGNHAREIALGFFAGITTGEKRG